MKNDIYLFIGNDEDGIEAKNCLEGYAGAHGYKLLVIEESRYRVPYLMTRYGDYFGLSVIKQVVKSRLEIENGGSD